MIGDPHTVTTRWGAAVTLSPFASVGATETALKAAGVLRPSDWSYAKDAEFARFPLACLTTMDDVDAFLAALDKAAGRTWRGECSKARSARASLAYYRERYGDRAFPWESEAARAVDVLSRARRTCCGCHETGSFARYERGKRERRPRA